VNLPVGDHAAFAFVADPRNLETLIPPFLGARVEGGSAEPGGIFVVTARRLGKLARWDGRWLQVESPRILVDTTAPGLVRSWRHEHRFAPDGSEGSVMTDTVTWELAGGWPGTLLTRVITRVIFPILFALRGETIRKALTP